MALFPTRVLVALESTEPSAASWYALETACELTPTTGSELHLVYVIVTSSTIRGRPLTPAQQDTATVEGHRVLEAGRERAKQLGVEVTETHLRQGEAVDHVLEVVQQQLDAGLLVIGARRSGSVALRMIGGSGGSGVVRRSTSSILVVRPPG